MEIFSAVIQYVHNYNIVVFKAKQGYQTDLVLENCFAKSVIKARDGN
jgi:hypothetical protein